jgi:site-specific DNA-methyltransferase (adenine-specific)
LLGGSRNSDGHRPNGSPSDFSNNLHWFVADIFNATSKRIFLLPIYANPVFFQKMADELTIEPIDWDYKLLARDCVEGMRGMAAESVDFVVTSPPYNLGIDYAKFDDSMERAKYLEWCKVWLTEIQRVLIDGGSFFLNVGASPKEPLFPHQMALLACECGWTIQNTFHWIKSVSVPDPQSGEMISVGHFKPINSKRFVNDCHEYVFQLTKTGTAPLDRLALGVPYQDKSNIKRWQATGGHDLRCRGNVWFVPYDTINSRDKDRPHPAAFPKQLVKNCLLIASANPASHVLDPFLGIGTSALAAYELGIRRFTGFEIDEQYLAVAHRVLSEAGLLNFTQKA